MRVLLTTNAAWGHLAPLVPTARALVVAGHDVRVGCPESFCHAVQDTGLMCVPCAEVRAPRDISEPPPASSHAERLRWAVSVLWPSAAASWISSLREAAVEWRPDLVVVEPVEHAGRVVAASLGVPVIEHGWGFRLPAGLTDQAADSIQDLYAEAGSRPAVPELRVDLGTAGQQAADTNPVPRFRYVPWSSGGPTLHGRDRRPRVLVTLGTFDNPRGAVELRSIATAAADAGAEVIAVLGNADRAIGGPFPPAVHLVSWVDMPNAVRTCDLVIHHGGAGTSWATLVAGIPAVVVPQMGDQFRNADLLSRAGVAMYVRDSAALGESIAEVLGGRGR